MQRLSTADLLIRLRRSLDDNELPGIALNDQLIADELDAALPEAVVGPALFARLDFHALQRRRNQGDDRRI